MLVSIVTGAVIAAACGLSTNGTGENVGDHPDAGTPVDATVSDVIVVETDGGSSPDARFDASAADAELDGDGGTYTCDGVDAGSVASCADCPGKPSACAATGACVTECASECMALRVACFRCTGGGATVIGTCEAESDAGYCLNGAYAGMACPCAAKDASACPGDFQICLDAGAGYACHSCGEPGTKDLVCKGGTGAMKCDLGPDAATSYTCR